MSVPNNTTGNQIQQIQDIIFIILCDVDDYCRKNHLTYYLSGGTCLGAVRHHGFIPWDDDADIMLQRKDYEIFINGFAEHFSTKYKCASLNTDMTWARPYSKIWDINTEVALSNSKEPNIGIGIDVFPIDGLPDKWICQKIYFNGLRCLNFCRYALLRECFLPNERYRRIKTFLRVFLKPFNSRAFAQRINMIAKKFDFETSHFVAGLGVHYWEKERIEKRHLSSAIYFPFRDRMLPVPIGYDQYLKNLYGDYMTIKQEDAQKGYTHSGWDVRLSMDNSK